jgi:hypothetical protein
MSGLINVLVSYGASAKAAYQKIIASDSALEAGALFGSAVAISDDGMYIVVGSYMAEPTDTGAAYVYFNNQGTWVEQAKLVASNPVAGDWFGYSVDITKTGDRIIVGAPHANALPDNMDNSGAAYIFKQSGTTWTEELYLSGGDGGSNDYFGNSVAINDDGTAIMVGAYGDDGSATSIGYIHTYEIPGSSWSTLKWNTDDVELPTTGSESDAFHGWSVAFDKTGTRCIEGSPMDNQNQPTVISNCGVVTIHTRNGASWTKDIWLQAPTPVANGQFGTCVDMNGDGQRVIIGAIGESPGSVTAAGSAYVYKKTGTVWALEQKLIAGDKTAGDNFGYSVSINDTGDRIAIGALNNNLPGKNDTGAVYIFDRIGTVWTQTVKLVAPDAGIGDKFGTSISLNSTGNGIIVGSPYNDLNAIIDAGAAYYFPLVAATVPNNKPTGSVTITGTAEEGQVLTATNTLADIDGIGIISYQWKSDGVDIVGATSNTYTLTSAEVGSKITVTATYIDGVGKTEKVTSSETAVVTAVAVAALSPEADGYYVGDLNGYKLYISPKSLNVIGKVLVGNNGQASTTLDDGFANTLVQKSNTLSGAYYCYNVTRGGHQWYLASKDELAFIFKNRSVLPAGQGFTQVYYITSTLVGGDFSYYMSQSGGFVNKGTLRGINFGMSARPIRREAIPLTGDVPGAAMEGGYFAGFWSETMDGVATHKIIIAPKSTEHTMGSTEGSGNGSLPAGLLPAGWSLPTRDQLNVCYYNLKPTTTANLTVTALNSIINGSNSHAVMPYTANRNWTKTDPVQSNAVEFKLYGSQAFASAAPACNYLAAGENGNQIELVDFSIGSHTPATFGGTGRSAHTTGGTLRGIKLIPI